MPGDQRAAEKQSERHKSFPEYMEHIVKLCRKRCQSAAFLATVLVALFSICDLSAQQTPETVAQLVRQIDGQLNAIEQSATSHSAAEMASALSEQIDQLDEKSIMVFGERRKQREESCDKLREHIANWATAVEVDLARCKSALAGAREAWALVKAQYPEEALEVLPPLWSCSMHAELMEPEAGTCGICGMSLDPIYVTQPELTQTPVIRAEILAQVPLEVGKKADLRIRLVFDSDSRPVTLDDLEEAHTRKIHLLISDMSKTDYHHEHPEPVAEGEYAFSFVPALPGTYRVWADLKPALTRVQQFSIADIPSTTPRQGQLARDEPENRKAEIDGYRFDLSFDKPVIQEKETVPGKLHVTGPDGKPFTRLEVVMGAFGHLVGFGEDTVLHIHPVGPPLLPVDALGGPDLPFYFRSNQAGAVRFFAQVKIGGKDFFPRFVINLQPRQRVPKL